MQIIDPHIHLWDLENRSYPWLVDPIDHFAGDYAAIRKSYLITDFLEDARRQDLVKAVHVQAELDHNDDPVEETAWLQSLADDPALPGFPHAIVAYADLAAPDVEETLARHRFHPNVRGIRQMLNHGPEPHLCFAPRGDLMHDNRWRAGLALLSWFGLSFDLQVWPWQMEEAAALARAFPDIPFILNNTGMPYGRGADDFARWRAGMRRLAQAGNVAVKISGFGMFDRTWTIDGIRPYVLDTIDTFGPDRCMFASNFPMEKLSRDYDGVWHAYLALTAAFSDDERRRLFHDNAARTYLC
jgi:predicted TIM-barrel fold metal-dependent hydrolase